MKPYAFGVDLGGTSIKIGFFRTDGSRIDKWEIPTRKEDNGFSILPDIADSIRRFLEKKELTMESVEGIGIDVPGAVLAGGVVNRCVNLGWGVRPVGAELSELLDGVRVSVLNDANAAALGEAKAAGNRSHVVVITLGTGVGGGVVLNGKIVTGAFGAAGEIGHIPVNPGETEVCSCGNRGCLEQYVSAEGILRLAKRKCREAGTDSVLQNRRSLTAKDIFDAAKEGDPTAKELVDTACEMLGRAMAGIACVVDPEAFILGGGVSMAGDILIETVEKYYRKYAFHASRETSIVQASMGNDAGMLGAVLTVLTD